MLKRRSFRGRRGGGGEGRTSSDGPPRSSFSRLQKSSRTDGRIPTGDSSFLYQRKSMRGAKSRGVTSFYGSRGVLGQNGVSFRKSKSDEGDSEEGKKDRPSVDEGLVMKRVYLYFLCDVCCCRLQSPGRGFGSLRRTFLIESLI